MKEYPETHQEGIISVEKELNFGFIVGDFGIQIAQDGRVWVCINGQAVLRFKPNETSVVVEYRKRKNETTHNRGLAHNEPGAPE